MRDAAAEQIQTECFWGIGPIHFPISDTELGDWHHRQPIQLGLDCWIGWFV
jgi:hypothetical protein